MFNTTDLQQLQSLGISTEKAEQQLENFKRGFPFLQVQAPATPDKGMIVPTEKQMSAWLTEFGKFNGTLLKFTPASGAASRMFKALFEAQDILARDEDPCRSGKDARQIRDFFTHLREFAFYRELVEQGVDCANVSNSKEVQLAVLQAMLGKDGMNYGALPKGLLTFHRYPDGARTAMEEHLVEAAHYAKDDAGKACLHFTVSPEHRELFENLVRKVQGKYEAKYGVRYEISFSEQKKSTDIIAVDSNNEPFRNADGSILFRPGGHGALIENLSEQRAEVVFVKNIDNIAPDCYKLETVRYKKALAGLLLLLRRKIFGYLKALDENIEPDKALIDEIQQFYEREFTFVFPQGWDENKVEYLRRKLNRPLRVCGMVRNVGEPGGGPFIAVNPDGSASLQVVESSQLDIANPDVLAIFRASTHFNPVDLVCSFIDYKGEWFDLTKFRDPATGFISAKSKDGRDLKAQELPGLWNGAMSDWNTVFVEVPLITFNPVKTVNDLLRKEHQG